MFYKKWCVYGLLILVLITGCAGIGDYDFQLIDKYYIFRSSAHSISIINGDSRGGDIIIPPKVVAIAFDDKYIVAKQYGLKLAYPDNPENTYEIPDESKEYYWIIDTTTEVVYGPYESENEFIDKKMEFNIENLELKDVNKYRKK